MRWYRWYFTAKNHGQETRKHDEMLKMQRNLFQTKRLLRKKPQRR